MDICGEVLLPGIDLDWNLDWVEMLSPIFYFYFYQLYQFGTGESTPDLVIKM